MDESFWLTVISINLILCSYVANPSQIHKSCWGCFFMFEGVLEINGLVEGQRDGRTGNDRPVCFGGRAKLLRRPHWSWSAVCFRWKQFSRVL